MKRKHLIPLLCLLLVCTAIVSLIVLHAQSDASIRIVRVEDDGSLILSCTGSEFLALGYDYGDIVSVTLRDHSYTMPVCAQFADVDKGALICRVTRPYVTLAIRSGNFHAHDPRLRKGDKVSFAMQEKAGYLSEYRRRELIRTYDRVDYPQLTDAQYANFRSVEMHGIGAGTLYRSSSPIDPGISRDTFALAAMEQSGVKTVLNLSDTRAEAENLAAYAGSYYAQQAVIFLGMSVNFASDEFQQGLAEGLRWIAAHDGPYLLHCHEGKDRTGFAAAILGCLAGASIDEITADYMLSYVNYFGVEPSTAQYADIAEANIIRQLTEAFGVDPRTADVQAEAIRYLHAIGLTDQSLDALRENLARSWTD